MQSLTLVRHGMSRGNKLLAAIRNGDSSQFSPSDIEEIKNTHSMHERLVPEGVKQAKAAGDWINENLVDQFDGFFVSPFPRAIETAIALELSWSNWEIARDLRERDHGLFDRHTPAEVAEKFPEYAKRRDQSRWLLTPPGGESVALLSLRVRLWLNDLEAHGHRRVLAVSHYDTISAILMWLTNMSIDEYHESQESKDGRLEIPNGTVIEFSDTNPDTGFSTPNEFCCFRKVTPADLLQNPNQSAWQLIERPTYTNYQLQDFLDEVYP